jgi:hypothetical protein
LTLTVSARSKEAVPPEIEIQGERHIMKRFLPSGIILFAGVLGIATAATTHTSQDITKIRRKLDLRETVLRRFFTEKHCPAQDYTEVFLAEADAHHLDWRLLPSLAFVESGGGRTSKGNNLFGWANGKQTFNSIGDAIHTVAATLSAGRAYRGKDTAEKLATYNRHLDYPASVMAIMRQIAPNPQVVTAD